MISHACKPFFFKACICDRHAANTGQTHGQHKARHTASTRPAQAQDTASAMPDARPAQGQHRPDTRPALARHTTRTRPAQTRCTVHRTSSYPVPLPFLLSPSLPRSAPGPWGLWRPSPGPRLRTRRHRGNIMFGMWVDFSQDAWRPGKQFPKIIYHAAFPLHEK